MGKDEYYSIYDVTIASMNRPHEHAHVEDGLDSYSLDWSLVERDDGLRRGSSHLYCVEGSYYVSCSRTGMEKAGNSLWFSKNSPDDLVFEVVCAVFEGVLRKRSIDIREGINKSELFSDGELAVSTPKQVVLGRECSEVEIEQYYDDLADLLYCTLEQYQSANSVEEITDVVEFYRDKSKVLYREYTDFEPSILSRVIPDLGGKNGWIIRTEEIDGGKRTYVILNENSRFDAGEEFVIEIIQDQEVKLVEHFSESVLEETFYETEDKLRSVLDEFMDYTVSELRNRS